MAKLWFGCKGKFLESERKFRFDYANIKSEKIMNIVVSEFHLRNLFQNNVLIDPNPLTAGEFIFSGFANETLSAIEKNDSPEYADTCLEISGIAIYKKLPAKQEEKKTHFVIIIDKEYSQVFNILKFETIKN